MMCLRTILAALAALVWLSFSLGCTKKLSTDERTQEILERRGEEAHFYFAKRKQDEALGRAQATIGKGLANDPNP